MAVKIAQLLAVAMLLYVTITAIAARENPPAATEAYKKGGHSYGGHGGESWSKDSHNGDNHPKKSYGGDNHGKGSHNGGDYWSKESDGGDYSSNGGHGGDHYSKESQNGDYWSNGGHDGGNYPKKSHGGDYHSNGGNGGDYSSNGGHGGHPAPHDYSQAPSDSPYSPSDYLDAPSDQWGSHNYPHNTCPSPCANPCPSPCGNLTCPNPCPSCNFTCPDCNWPPPHWKDCSCSRVRISGKPAGLIECGGECLDPAGFTNVLNCGSCGNACDEGQTCDCFDDSTGRASKRQGNGCTCSTCVTMAECKANGANSLDTLCCTPGEGQQMFCQQAGESSSSGYVCKPKT